VIVARRLFAALPLDAPGADFALKLAAAGRTGRDVHELEGRVIVELIGDLLLELLRRELQNVAGRHQARRDPKRLVAAQVLREIEIHLHE